MELRRREFAALMLGGAAALSLAGQADAESDPLPSWNAGPAKDAIVKFVHATTDAASPTFVPLAERVATFDQDGTLWVEHPIYTQLVYCFDRVPALVNAKPELAKVEPFRTVLTGNREVIARLGLEQLIKVAAATLTGMDVDTFRYEVAKWIADARDPRWKRPYTELVYQPQIELLTYLRSVGYYGAKGPVLIKEPKLLLNDDNAGKPENIHLMIGRRPYFAFGNSTGDRQMLEYTKAGGGVRLAMLVLHDDGEREYAYGPAHGLPDTKVGRFTPELYDEATKDGWIVVSMKNDWKRIFAFE